MKIEQVAAQLYTLRDHLKTPDQIASSLRKVRKMGFASVELAGLGAIDTTELKRMLDGEGLICCSTHENSHTILESPETVVEKLNILGSTYTAYPFPSGIELSSPRAVRQFAKKLGAAGQVLREAGKVLLYHNHDIEFARVRGRMILETVMDETDPPDLQAELDTHWIQAGGCDPVSWIQRLAGRLPVLHMKDYVVTLERKHVITQIGDGNLNWPEIISAADESGCTWYVIEHDENWIDNDPFKALKRSYAYVKDHLAR